MKSLSTSILRAAFVIILAEAAAAQQPAPGTLQGVVAKEGSTDTLPNVTVELRAASAAAGPAVAATTTDSRGQFLFPRVLPGSYRVVATRPGYVTAEYGQPRPGAPGLAISVVAGQQTADVRLRMTPGGVIAGRVTDRGQPRALAAVVALKSTYYDGNRTMTPVLSARTDDLGDYHLFWLPPGEYLVAAVVFDGIGINPLTAGLFINPDGDSNSFATQRYTIGPVLQRAIASGAAATEMHVPIYYPGTADWGDARSIDVQPGAEVRVNIDAAPQPTRRVQGTLTGAAVITDADGKPVVTQVFMAIPGLPLANFNQAAIVIVDAEPNGAFEIPRLAPGAYLMNVAQRGGHGARMWIDLRDHDALGVTLAMLPGLTVSGRVVLDPSVAAAALPPVTSLIVRLRWDPFIAQFTYVGTPKADGSFKIIAAETTRPMQTGDYKVTVEPILMPPTAPGTAPRATPPALRNAYVKSIRMGDKDVLNDGLHLQSQPQEELLIVIGVGTGTLQGRVVNERRQPVTAASVGLIPEGGLRFRVDHQFTSTDASGRFQIEAIPPGDYKVFAWEEVEKGQWQDPEFVRNHEGAGKPVRIEPGGLTGEVEVASIPRKRR